MLLKPTRLQRITTARKCAATSSKIPSCVSRYSQLRATSERHHPVTQSTDAQLRVKDDNAEARLGLNRRVDGEYEPEDPTPPPEDRGKRKMEEISDREWEMRTDNGRNHSGELESIYSPKIRLIYTPPVKLPSPFPTTLQIEGIPLYMASSVFVRHTLNTLYSDLHIELLRVSVQDTPNHGSEKSIVEDNAEREKSKRNKSLFVGLCVRGTSRVSGAIGEWQV
ncbi:hypothetical protein HWV62_16778 [Athelia sp. TMB]|nr:hypothetical protein HWV62_16778 [Athelia sp. TMB]